MLSWQQNLTIRTEEGVRFSYMLASPMSRFLAILLDWLVVMLIGTLLRLILAFVQFLSVDLANAAALLAGFLLSLIYPMLCEWCFRGQTIGKRVLRIRVIDEEGLNLTLPQVIVRNMLRAIDSLPLFYLFGGLVAALTPKAQRLGDLVASTVVIQHIPAAQPDLDQLRASKYNSFRSLPHLCARLRQRTSPREAAVAADAIMRREEFDDDARVQLFASLREHFEEKVAFPEETTFGISDERYIRNVVDVLFEASRSS